MGELTEKFSSDERICHRREFLSAYATATRIHTRSLVFYIAQNNRMNHRLGLTVSRKIGKACSRNRLKRRLRELFRTHKDLLATPCDIVVNAKRSGATASFERLELEYRQAIAQWKRKTQLC